jgi:hypothetical protein
VTRPPKRVASLVGLAVERIVREAGTLDAVPAAVAPATADLANTLFPEGHTRKEAP